MRWWEGEGRVGCRGVGGGGRGWMGVGEWVDSDKIRPWWGRFLFLLRNPVPSSLT